VVVIAVVLVVSEDEDRLLPDLRIAGEDVQHLRDVPGSIPGRGGMVGEILRSHQP
jgi:hypothetical protein